MAININDIRPDLYTVADIFLPVGNKEFYSVTFYQSARYYKLMRKNKNCATALRLLKQSKKSNLPVMVYLTEKYSDIIDRVFKIKK